jgi:hypothetical protein
MEVGSSLADSGSHRVHPYFGTRRRCSTRPQPSFMNRRAAKSARRRALDQNLRAMQPNLALEFPPPAADPTPPEIALHRMAVSDTDVRITLATQVSASIFTGRQRILWDVYVENAHKGHSVTTIRAAVEQAGCSKEHDDVLDMAATAGNDDASIEALIESVNQYGRKQLLTRAAEDVARQLATGVAVEDVRVQLVERAQAIGKIGAATDPRFRLLDEEELESLPKSDWLIDSVIPSGGLLTLIGKPKSYKSFLALDWALSIALGLEWCGHRTRQGGVVYVCAEGASGLQKRVAAWKRYADVGSGVLTNIKFLPRRVKVNERLDVAELLSAIHARCSEPPVAVIFDTLARNMSGNENDTGEMGAFIDGCDTVREETGASVVVVHHTGHAEATRARGNSSLPGAVDTQILCSRDDDRLTIECPFQKDDAEFAPLYMEATPVASSLVLQRVGADSGELKGNRRHALAVLHDQFGDEGSASGTWKKETGLANGSFYDARKWLTLRAYVTTRKRRYHVTDSGRLALSPKSKPCPVGLQPTCPTSLQTHGVYKDTGLEKGLGLNRGEAWEPEDSE